MQDNIDKSQEMTAMIVTFTLNVSDQLGIFHKLLFLALEFFVFCYEFNLFVSLVIDELLFYFLFEFTRNIGSLIFSS